MKNKFIEIIKGKWLRNIVLTILLFAIIICAYLGAIYGMSKLHLTEIDFTKEKIYSISQATKDKLQNMDQEVTISVHNMYEYVKEFAYKYANLNKNITVEEVENLTAKTDWKTTYGVDETSAFILIQSGGREKILRDSDLYTYDYTTYEQIDVTEEAITNAILDVTISQKPKICFLTGHNLYMQNYFQYLELALTSEVNEVEYVDLLTLGEIPEDCKVLVITALKEDLTEKETDTILNYIRSGGELLILVEPNLHQITTPNFDRILEEYGVTLEEGFILEGDTNYMMSGSSSLVISTINNNSEIVRNMNMGLRVCMMNPGKLTISSEEELQEKNVTADVLATVSDKAFYRTDISLTSPNKAGSDEEASGAVIAAMFDKKIGEDDTSKMIIFSSSAFATNMQMRLDDQYYMYAINAYNNEDILLNSVSYLTQREDNITIRKTGETVTTYDVTEAQNRIVLTIIFAIPVAIIIIGFIVWILRRRKK